MLADDHALVRAGLKRLLEDDAGIEVVGEADNGETLVELAATLCPDVVLADVSMPGPGPLALLRALAKASPTTRVLIITMHRDAALAQHVLALGAAGYICKSNAYPVLSVAIDTIRRGGLFVDPDLIGELLSPQHGAPGTRHEQLSAREHEVLHLIAAGKRLKAIAHELHISAKTVASHKRRLMAKLGVTSTAELIRYAMKRRDGDGKEWS